MTTRVRDRASGRPAPHGFTLFELLLVIAIIGVLAAVSIPRFSDYRAAAYDARSQQDLRNLASAQELHRATHEAYAAGLTDLTSFSPSEGVEIRVEAADRTLFRARASHPSGLNAYTWHSDRQPSLQSDRVR